MPKMRIFPQLSEGSTSLSPMEWAWEANLVCLRPDLRGPGDLPPLWLGEVELASSDWAGRANLR